MVIDQIPNMIDHIQILGHQLDMVRVGIIIIEIADLVQDHLAEAVATNLLDIIIIVSHLVVQPHSQALGHQVKNIIIMRTDKKEDTIGTIDTIAHLDQVQEIDIVDMVDIEREAHPPRKLPTFSGEDKTWKPFIYQFERFADRYHWSTRTKADRLKDCLSGKALELVQKMKIGNDYKVLCHKLKKRFGSSDEPITVRRNLQFVKQKEGESLEEFGQRVLFLVMDGLPGAKEKHRSK